MDSSLSRMRTRLHGAVYDEVFRLVLGIVESKGLLRGKVAGVDSARPLALAPAVQRRFSSRDDQKPLGDGGEEPFVRAPCPHARRRR
jgi:hypothetical protein